MKIRLLLALAMLAGTLWLLFPETRQIIMNASLQKIRPYSVDGRLAQFGAAASERLAPYFQRAGLIFPPTAVSLLAFKDRKQLELYARDSPGAWQFVRTYPIQALSGGAGPKLREGDRQVPEGIYAIELLNPNSLFHVSLRLDYPNAFDRAMGLADGREALGSDIMIHGSNKSIGCLAMGDEVAEELFALAAWVGTQNMQVIIAPTDFRRANAQIPNENVPTWTTGLYQTLRTTLAQYRLLK